MQPKATPEEIEEMKRASKTRKPTAAKAKATDKAAPEQLLQLVEALPKNSNRRKNHRPAKAVAEEPAETETPVKSPPLKKGSNPKEQQVPVCPRRLSFKTPDPQPERQLQSLQQDTITTIYHHILQLLQILMHIFNLKNGK